MTTYFISDLHLQVEQPKITEFFLNFLQSQARNADALYILGDLFEVWLGDDDSRPFAKTIKTSLSSLVKSGTPVYIMRGNRDFAIGELFAQETGITLLADPSVVDIYGQRILLMHGDLLCTDDVKYQEFRRKINNPRFLNRLLRLPFWLRRLLAHWARQRSKKHTQATQLTIQDVNAKTVNDFLKQYPCEILIHGHTHRPDTHYIEQGNKTLQRWVLAAWHEQGEALAIETDGRIHRVTLN